MKNLFNRTFRLALCAAGVAVFLSAVSGCKHKTDKLKRKNVKIEKFTIRFKSKDNGGTLSAKIKGGEEINSPAQIEKGQVIVFTAKADEKNGFRVKSWKGANASHENAETAELTVMEDSYVRVIFESIFPDGFVPVHIPENPIEGLEPDYPLPGKQSWRKGVFVKNRKVKLSRYIIAKYQVTYRLWYEVRKWAENEGYVFENKGLEGWDGFAGGGNYPAYKNIGNEPTGNSSHPVVMINWRDCIVWCNAYTEMKNGNDTECVYRKSKDNAAVLKDATEKEGSKYVCDKAYFDKTKKGFRLPTEAEWEYAARWQGFEGDSVDKTNAVKHGEVYLTKLDSASGSKGNWKNKEETEKVAWLNSNSKNKTSPVGNKYPNALELYDMSGNVWEWCFDWDAGANPGAEDELENGIAIDPSGAKSGFNRTKRGGSWNGDSTNCCLGERNSYYPDDRLIYLGFRLACSIR